MPTSDQASLNEVLNYLDLEAIADPNDKLYETEFFLHLASIEKDRMRFRWLISAYLNAVYSFFETSALYASVSFTDPITNNPIEDSDTIEILKNYIKISQNNKNPYFVKTSGLHPAVAKIYAIRKVATHHFPLEIMVAGPNLPEDFHLGSMKGSGEPLLGLCREVFLIMKELHATINN